jgi:hypothetical protein
MPLPLKASEVLDREFLEIRAKLLQVAAHFDRLERAAGTVADDPRLAKIHAALEVLDGTEPGRAEKLQMIFSREYTPEWRTLFEIPAADKTSSSTAGKPAR